MYNFRLNTDNNFDFILSEDAVEYKRDYNQYEIFNIDVTKSLYSTAGVPVSGVTLNNISLTGYDNGLLNNFNLPEYYGSPLGSIVFTNSYDYTFSNTSYIHNFESINGFDANQPILFEADMPIMTSSDFMFLYVTNNDTFSSTMGSSYVDGIRGDCNLNNTFSNTSVPTKNYDRYSIYIDGYNVYSQINGVTINSFTYTGSTNIRLALAFFADSPTSYTVKNIRIYNQKIYFSGTTFDITDSSAIPISGSTIPITGVTYGIGNTRFKLNPVTGFTGNYDYKVVKDTVVAFNESYHQLLGGFYQGFFKVFGYPVEYFKTRANKGWTVNMMLALTSATQDKPILNDLHNSTYPITPMSGMVFYMGTRAENKYLTITGTAINTILDKTGIVDNDIPDVTTERISQIFKDTNLNLFNKKNLYTYGDEFLLNGSYYEGFYYILDGHYYVDRGIDIDKELFRKTNYNDIINNAFSIFFYNGYIGYRTIYATEPCYTGSSENPIANTPAITLLDPNTIDENSFIDVTDVCDINNTVKKIVTKDFTIEEVMSKTPKINIDNPFSRFLYVSVVFERDFSYDTDCELKYGKYKKGRLTIYFNGVSVFSYDNFTEIIPHELDTTTYLQEGVPFNISFGGGTQGLVEEVNSVGNTISAPINKILDKFFTYTFIGGVRSIQMYMTPLNVLEIRDILKNNNFGLEPFIGGRTTKHKITY